MRLHLHQNLDMTEEQQNKCIEGFVLIESCAAVRQSVRQPAKTNLNKKAAKQ